MMGMVAMCVANASHFHLPISNNPRIPFSCHFRADMRAEHP